MGLDFSQEPNYKPLDSESSDEQESNYSWVKFLARAIQVLAWVNFFIPIIFYSSITSIGYLLLRFESSEWLIAAFLIVSCIVPFLFWQAIAQLLLIFREIAINTRK